MCYERGLVRYQSKCRKVGYMHLKEAAESSSSLLIPRHKYLLEKPSRDTSGSLLMKHHTNLKAKEMNYNVH
jgi:hypothetical protein